jgi:NAD(P)-dependent dehydrogenase (short-subunit alcohol dehydrogenase family)
MQIQGKIALVTGGTSGIGLATVRRLRMEGATVIASSREGERLRKVAESLGQRGDAIAADLADVQDISHLMAQVKERYSRLDILVVNAGISHTPPIQDIDLASYAALMGVNCRGAAFTFAKAVPLLAEGAAVVFVGSIAGRKGQPGDALYAGSKGFIRAFARTLGTDPALLARGIRVNVVSPGPIATPLTEEATGNPEVSAYVERLVPMGRWGQAEEVAEAILFLASTASRFTTGAEITVDGGMAHV